MRPRLRRVLGIVLGVVAAAAVVLVVSGALRPWWDGFTMGGVDRTIINDTGRTIVWECGTGDRTMRPSETETLHFATRSEDASACDRGDDVEMCVDKYGRLKAPIAASDALREWACS